MNQKNGRSEKGNLARWPLNVTIDADFRISALKLPEERDIARTLLTEFASENPAARDCGIDEEITHVDGVYDGLHSAFLLGHGPVAPFGGVGLKRLTPSLAEIKRLYVRRGCRRLGLARRLLEAALSLARTRRVENVVLECLPGANDAAIALYLQFGFTDIPPYYDSSIINSRFMGLRL